MAWTDYGYYVQLSIDFFFFFFFRLTGLTKLEALLG